MIIDGQYDGPGVSLEMLLHRRTLHQCKRQHDRFTTLDGVEVLYDRFGEAFHRRTAEAAPSTGMGDQRQKKHSASNGTQVAVSREDKCEVLGERFAQRDVSRS